MRKVFFAILMICISTLTFSQGIKGGLNIANLNGDGTKPKTGYHVGIFFNSKKSEKFGFQPEIIYSRQGAEYGNGELKYDYLNVPIMMNFYPTPNFFIQAGPQVGCLISAKLEYPGSTANITSGLNKFDFSVGLGSGYETDKVLLEVRYNLGINGTVSEGDEGTYANRVLQISIGVKF